MLNLIAISETHFKVCQATCVSSGEFHNLTVQTITYCMHCHDLHDGSISRQREIPWNEDAKVNRTGREVEKISTLAECKYWTVMVGNLSILQQLESILKHLVWF